RSGSVAGRARRKSPSRAQGLPLGQSMKKQGPPPCGRKIAGWRAALPAPALSALPAASAAREGPAVALPCLLPALSIVRYSIRLQRRRAATGDRIVISVWLI